MSYQWSSRDNTLAGDIGAKIIDIRNIFGNSMDERIPNTNRSLPLLNNHNGQETSRRA